MVWTMSKKLIPLVEKYADSKLVINAVANAPKVTEREHKRARKNICEHDRVDYKAIQSLMNRSTGIIENLAEALSKMEARFDETKHLLIHMQEQYENAEKEFDKRKTIHERQMIIKNTEIEELKSKLKEMKKKYEH